MSFVNGAATCSEIRLTMEGLRLIVTLQYKGKPGFMVMLAGEEFHRRKHVIEYT